jgi:hypothetical protein
VEEKISLSNELIAGFLLTIVLSIGILAISSISGYSLVGNSGPLNIYLVMQDAMYNSCGQKFAHFAMLFLLAAIVFTGPFLVKIINKFATKNLAFFLKSLIYFGLAIFVLSGFFFWQDKPLNLLLGIVFIFMFYIYKNYLKSKSVACACTFFVIILLILSQFPGVLGRFDLSACDPTEIVSIQRHYNLVVAEGDRLAHGFKLLTAVTPHYGLLLPLICAIWQAHISPLAIGDYVNIMRFLQMISILSAAILFYLYSGRRMLYAFLPIIGLLPLYHFGQTAIAYPNNGPWRMFGFVLAVAILYIARNLSLNQLCLLLGATSGITILYNLETGIAITLGLIAYLYFRYRPFAENVSKLPIIVFLFFLSMLMVFAAYILGCYFGLGYIPDFLAFKKIFLTASFIGKTGFSGRKLLFSPMPFLVFAHAAYVLIINAIKFNKPFDFKHSFRAAIATMIIFWFAYYMNSPVPSYINSYWFMYSFLLIDLLKYLQANIRQAKAIVGPAMIAMFALSLAIIPRMVITYQEQLPVFVNALRVAIKGPARADAVEISGVYFDKNIANEIIDKTQFLKSIAGAGNQPMYITANGYLLGKISGIYPPLPYADTFAEIFSKNEYDNLIQAIAASNEKYIYFDAANSLLAGNEFVRGHYAQIRSDLSKWYEKTGQLHGFEIWTKKESN